MPPPTNPALPPPSTFAQQELHYAVVALQARGWVVSDAREDGQTLTLIARRTIPGNPIDLSQLRAGG
jgi:hypothetical protein